MPPKRRRARRPTTGPNMGWIAGGAIAVVVLAGILIAVSQFSAAARNSPPASTAAPSALDACGGLECGQANAPATIEIYSDFQ